MNDPKTDAEKSEWLELALRLPKRIVSVERVDTDGIPMDDAIEELPSYWNPFTDPTNYQQLEDLTVKQDWFDCMIVWRYCVDVDFIPLNSRRVQIKGVGIAAKALALYLAWRAVKGETDADPYGPGVTGQA